MFSSENSHFVLESCALHHFYAGFVRERPFNFCAASGRALCSCDQGFRFRLDSLDE